MTVLAAPIAASAPLHRRSSRLVVKVTAPAPTATDTPAATSGAVFPIARTGAPSRAAAPARSGTSVPLDRDLVTKLQAGDPESWRSVVDRYQGLVCATARRIVSTTADVDEVAQRTWTALWRHADAVRDLDRLAGWLGVTARREALGILRRRREVLVGDVALFDCGAHARQQHGHQLWSEATTRSSQDSGALVEQQQQVRALRAAVQKLPERQRRLVTALLTDRMSYDELSTSLGIPRGSIGPMRARALVTLRSLLRDWEG